MTSLRRIPVVAASHRIGKEAVSFRRPQEPPELLVGPGPAFGLLDRLQPRRAGDEGDVAGEQPAAHGVAERAPDDEVDAVDRLG
jgi:hypothetical protein